MALAVFEAIAVVKRSCIVRPLSRHSVTEASALVADEALNGRIPLHHACCCNASVDTIRSLVESLPESVNVVGENARIPLQDACFMATSCSALLHARREWIYKGFPDEKLGVF
jgi:hypothetical protein